MLALAFWQRAPLLRARLRKDHLLFQLPFLVPFIRNGVWDRWCGVVLQWKYNCDALEEMLSSPVAKLQANCPPFLIVAALMEHVQVHHECSAKGQVSGVGKALHVVAGQHYESNEIYDVSALLLHPNYAIYDSQILGFKC